jgi:hypothetical protein
MMDIPGFPVTDTGIRCSGAVCRKLHERCASSDLECVFARPAFVLAVLDWLVRLCVASRAGNVCSPLLPLVASRCTPREEARDGAFWMKRLFCSRLLALRLVSRAARQ